MKTMKRVLCAILCVCMMLGTLMTLASCDTKKPEAPVETDDPNADKIQVVRAIMTIEAGTKLVRSQLEEVMIDKSLVPASAATSIKDIANQFLKVDVYSGDFILTEKVSKTADFGKTNEPVHEDYVVVTDYMPTGENDMAKCIQKAIDENPNRTIYIPDGNYLLYRPIKTSADPEKAVSLRLSNYAYLLTSENRWEGGDAIVELGALDSDKDASYSFVGGVVCGGNVTAGICVKGGDAFINNFSLKQTTTGIAVKEGARADIDSGVVIGKSSADGGSIGVLIESDECTVTNMRLAYIWVGIKVTGENNIFRNLHPLYIGTEFNTCCGFWDEGTGNFFDVCYSDQFAIGFRIGPNTKSIFNGCFVMWYMGEYDGTQYGFLADGQFNSIIRDTVVSLSWKQPDVTFLRVSEAGGNGVVLYPRISTPSNDDYLIVENGKVVGGDYYSYVKTEFLS